jgi:hypothetical protein
LPMAVQMNVADDDHRRAIAQTPLLLRSPRTLCREP